MIIRHPPRVADWLLLHFGPAYHRESLSGDLLEEYHQGRTTAWYWKQTFAAVGIGVAERVRTTIPRVAASTLLRFLTEATALMGAIALAQQVRHVCPAGWFPAMASAVTFVAGIGLCLSIGFYLSMTMRPHRDRPMGLRRSVPIKRLSQALLVTALSAGTLTWAGAAPLDLHQCSGSNAIPASNASASSSNAVAPMSRPTAIRVWTEQAKMATPGQRVFPAAGKSPAASTDRGLDGSALGY